MQRANSVSEVTRNPVDSSHTEEPGEEKRNPPGVSTGGSQMRVNAGAGDATGNDFASAFCWVAQARDISIRLISEAERLWKVDGAGCDAECVWQLMHLYREAWDIYKGAFSTYVRDKFPTVIGVKFADFEDAIEVVGEKLIEAKGVDRLRGYVVSPEVFGDE